ncbi:MAG: glycerol kinase GlpK [Ruminococcus sp.]|nr:glycerol kinase GlpK [Ruminococcus sp.]
MKYILSLDQGTTSSRAIIFDENQNIVSTGQREFTQHFPKEGWVEHNPEEILSSQYSAINEALSESGINPLDIVAVGITNQRETTVIWDKNTGKPIYNAIVWQCRRTAPYIERLEKQGLCEKIQQKTGLIPDAYYSATKIRWILDNVDGANERAKNGELLFGTIDSWLVWNLTNGTVHCTDRTNASRTMLFNIDSCDWDDELLEIFDIPKAVLPQIKCSGDYYGNAKICGEQIPIYSVVGDQQAALFGQCCFKEGMAKNTYGTGCFLLMNTGENRRQSKSGLVNSVAAGLKDEAVQYILEGSVFIGGAVIQWLRDEMRFFSSSRDAEYLAKKVGDTGGVYFVPAFTGLGAPYWDMYARGAILGLTRGTKREHIIRAAQESIAYQSADLFSAMECDYGDKIKSLNVDGGACRDEFLMQFQSDILDRKLIKPSRIESTALGAAYLAGLSCGLWESKDELNKMRRIEREYLPDMTQEKRSMLIKEWHKAVSRSQDWITK